MHRSTDSFPDNTYVIKQIKPQLPQNKLLYYDRLSDFDSLDKYGNYTFTSYPPFPVFSPNHTLTQPNIITVSTIRFVTDIHLWLSMYKQMIIICLSIVSDKQHF